jgi:hypothetical protein
MEEVPRSLFSKLSMVPGLEDIPPLSGNLPSVQPMHPMETHSFSTLLIRRCTGRESPRRRSASTTNMDPHSEIWN